MSLRDRTVIVNDEGKFLGFDRIWFVESDQSFYSHAKADEAIRQARRWWEKYGTKVGEKLVPGRRVFVSTNYGYADQCDQEVFPDGSLGRADYPHAPMI